jgi:G3E family GTPase
MGGCLCCSGRRTILDSISQLLERRNEFQHLLIECSGTALPIPLVEALLCEKNLFISICVVSVIDLSNWRRRFQEHSIEMSKIEEVQSTVKEKELRKEVRQQLSIGDVLLLNKVDLISTEQLISTKKEILEQLHLNSSRHSVKIIESMNGVLDLSIILSIHKDYLDVGAENQTKNLVVAKEIETKSKSKKKNHEDIYEFGIFGYGDVNKRKLEEFLKTLLDQKGDFIYRIKGVFNIEQSKFVLQAVHNTFQLVRLSTQQDKNYDQIENKKKILNRILFIGHPKVLDFPGWKEIKKQLELCFEGTSPPDLSFTM